MRVCLWNVRNPSPDVKAVIANATGHGSSGAKAASNNKGRNAPYIPPQVAGDENARYAGGATRTQPFNPTGGAGAGGVMGTSAKLKGTGATLGAGVLTFTLDDPSSPDNGKPVSYKVVRPAIALSIPNAPKPYGNFGVWMGEDPQDSEYIVQFYVLDNGTVMGSVMSGMAAQAMKRMMMANPAGP